MMLLLDDFHNIYTIRLPDTNLKLSLATHMVSSLFEIQTTIPAICLPLDKNNIHSTPDIVINGISRKCVGGIKKEYVDELFKNGLDEWTCVYMLKIPRNYHQLSAKGLKTQLREFRYVRTFSSL